MITFKKTLALKDYDAVSLAEQLRTHFVNRYPLKTVRKLEDAIKVASYLHRNDVRRGARGKHTNPAYIEHPLRVALRMATTFEVKQADWIIAAVLHDTVEDHAEDFADFEGVISSVDVELQRANALGYISTQFGFGVADLVKTVSNPVVPKGISKEEKIQQYQEHVEHAVKGHVGALLIKISDLIDNGGSLHHHYEYGDAKVMYFVNRYDKLINVYKDGMLTYAATPPFNWEATLIRLQQVKEEFDKFKEAQQ